MILSLLACLALLLVLRAGWKQASDSDRVSVDRAALALREREQFNAKEVWRSTRPRKSA